jgi:hypothetical protein
MTFGVVFAYNIVTDQVIFVEAVFVNQGKKLIVVGTVDSHLSDLES